MTRSSWYELGWMVQHTGDFRQGPSRSFRPCGGMGGAVPYDGVGLLGSVSRVERERDVLERSQQSYLRSVCVIMKLFVIPLQQFGHVAVEGLTGGALGSALIQTSVTTLSFTPPMCMQGWLSLVVLGM